MANPYAIIDYAFDVAGRSDLSGVVGVSETRFNKVSGFISNSGSVMSYFHETSIGDSKRHYMYDSHDRVGAIILMRD